MSDPDQKILQGILSIAEANNFMGVNLHKLLAEENQNVFFSPFSLSTALAMLFCGARGQTAVEMESVLGYEHANMKDVDSALVFETIMSSLETNPEDYILTMANSLLSQHSFKVNDDYKSLLRNNFKASLFEVDFMNEKETLHQINEWVKAKTRGKIPSLMDSIDSTTVLVLLNAVYFNGNWLLPFEAEKTYFQRFYNLGQRKNIKKVPMMHLKDEFLYIQKEDFQALQLPYRGNEIAMMILLPNSIDGLEALESKLTYKLLPDLIEEMCRVEVEVALPKFKLEFAKSLREYFQKLGLKAAFEPGAEFSGITQSGNLFISEIVHKTVLDVNEEGTEAAAVTDIIINQCFTDDLEFIVNHPFAFAIYNTKNNLILFIGRVNEL